MDYHTNIFYYYGRDDSSAEGETQLENNTTKALINTLQYSSPEVKSQFLTDVLDTQVLGEKFRFQFQSERSSHELQNAIKKAKKLFVLALTPNGHSPTGSMGSGAESFITQADRYSLDKNKILKFIDEFKTKFLTGDLVELDNKTLKNRFPKLRINSLTKEDIFDLYDHFIRGSIPDAWIFWGQNVVLIENKTKSEVTQSQIQRHLRLLSKYNHKTKPVLVIKSWRKHISKYLARLKAGERSNFLLGQLRQYLEAINMGELKFTYDDFLALDELDSEQVKQIRLAH